MKDHTNEIKQAGLIFIFLPLAIVFFSIAIGVYLPVFGWVAIFTILGGFWLFAFASFNFQYVVKHSHDWKNYGSAELINMEAAGITYQVIKTATNMIISLEDISPIACYLGRWTLYYNLNTNTQIWHDHSTFGGDWYYIQY